MIGLAVGVRRRAAVLWCYAVALLLIIAASYAYSIYETPRNGSVAFFSPFTRAFELGLGAAVAVAEASIRRLPGSLASWLGVAGLLGMLGSAMLFDDRTTWPGSAVLIPTAATALVIVAGTIRRQAPTGRLLGWAPLRWLGSRSYSLCLWHWPILTIATQRAAKPELPQAQALALVGVALILAELTGFAMAGASGCNPSLGVLLTLGGLACA